MNLNELTCLWMFGDLPKLQQMCLKSWLKRGYKVVLYSYAPFAISFKNDNLEIRDAIEIMELPKVIEGSVLPASDLWRFIYLYQKGGTWIDFDMVMLKRLPEDEFIISSEHCQKKGAYARKNTDKTANIGILRFPKEDQWLKGVIAKIQNTKQKDIRPITYMQIFQKELEKLDFWKELVSHPDEYCPISWAYSKNIYTNGDLGGNKYAIDQKDFDWIHDNSYCIHMWNNHLRTKYNDLELDQYPDSIYNKLCLEFDPPKPSYRIAIPSYKRAKLCRDKTLAFLEKKGISKSSISIFVNDSDEQTEYLKINPEYEIINTKTSGIGNVRTFIRDFYEIGTDLLIVDDDIRNIIELIPAEYTKDNRADSIENLHKFIEDGFDKCREVKATLWGVCLFDNPFFLKKGFTTNLKYIGAFYGVIVTHNTKAIKVTIDQFEDFQYSMEHFLLDGVVLRYSNIGLVSNWYNQNGGICANKGGLENRLKESVLNGDMLVNKYRGMLKLYNKKDGTLNIKLNHNFKKIELI